MQGQVGASQDMRAQQGIDANMAQYYEGQNQQMNNLQGYLSNVMGIGGQGGGTTQTTPGVSTGQQIGGAALGGLGAYGALAANPVTAPFAIAGGVGAGLMGLL
jgi:hypothetical protein